MKTIKEIEKEIERIKGLKEDENPSTWIHSQMRINLFKTEAKLEQTNEIIKIIENVYPDLDTRKDRGIFLKWRDRLIKEIRGEND